MYQILINYSVIKKNVGLRNETIFKNFPKTPMSILIEAIENFICQGKNANQAYKFINEKYYLTTAGQKTIFRFFKIIRKCIAQYYQEQYKIEKLVYENEGKNICIDKSLFVHYSNGDQIWVVGLINVVSKKIRLELVKERSSQILQKIIFHHIGFNNTIITDGWEGYNWIRDYRYYHIIHIHGRHDFGSGNESTSCIESIWGIFKGMITRYYNALNADNFVYFLRELEFRYNTRDMNANISLIELKDIFEFCYSTCNYEFYEINELNDYNKENYSNSDEVEDNESDD